MKNHTVNIFHTSPLLIPAVCMMAGIVLGNHLFLSIPLCILLLLAMVIVTALLGRWAKLQTLGIVLSAVVLGLLVIEMDHSKVDDGEPSRIERTQQYFLHQRTLLLERLQSAGLSDDQYAVVAAMALGDKSTLTHQLKETYSKTGASHILALSGLHLGIIYALLSMLVVGRRWQMITQVAIILSIWAFVFLVGMSASVVRSAVMLTVYALLAIGHRRKMSVNTLAFTAIIMLLVTPKALFDVGFQMSFMAVFSILLFVPLGRIPDDAPSCKLVMGHGGGVDSSTDWRGSIDSLLLWTLLVLFPADQLHRHSSGNRYPLPCIGHISHPFNWGYPCECRGIAKYHLIIYCYYPRCNHRGLASLHHAHRLNLWCHLRRVLPVMADDTQREKGIVQLSQVKLRS